jgi:shikimate kinase
MRSVGRRASSSASKNPARAVFLVGFMGAGKSSVGRALGELLGWVFEDLDRRIEREAHSTVAEIFEAFGEEHFRRVERIVLQDVLLELRGGRRKNRVIALGGGTFAQQENHKILEASGVPTVFLAAPVEELWRRCQAESQGKRPLQTSPDKFRETYLAREEFYRRATVRIETEGKAMEAVAAEIAEVLKRMRTEQGEVE